MQGSIAMEDMVASQSDHIMVAMAAMEVMVADMEAIMVAMVDTTIMVKISTF